MFRNSCLLPATVLIILNNIQEIPPEMEQTRLAAQLALMERSRLEGCGLGWKELELMAYQLEHDEHPEQTP